MAGILDIYCDKSLAERSLLLCDQFNMSGQQNAVIFKSGATTTDPTNATTILADLAAGLAYKMLDIMIDIPKSAAKFYASKVNGSQTKTGETFTCNYEDLNVALGNDTFYTDLNQFVGAKMLIENANADFNTWIDNTRDGIKFDVSMVQALADTEPISYMGTFNFSFNANYSLVLADKVDGIFVLD